MRDFNGIIRIERQTEAETRAAVDKWLGFGPACGWYSRSLGPIITAKGMIAWELYYNNGPTIQQGKYEAVYE